MSPLRNTYSANFLPLLLADVTFISLPTFLFLSPYTPLYRSSWFLAFSIFAFRIVTTEVPGTCPEACLPPWSLQTICCPFLSRPSRADNSSFLTYVVLGSFAFKDTKRGCCKKIAAAQISLRKASFWLFWNNQCLERCNSIQNIDSFFCSSRFSPSG